jgi:hypothetical protein
MVHGWTHRVLMPSGFMRDSDTRRLESWKTLKMNGHLDTGERSSPNGLPEGRREHVTHGEFINFDPVWSWPKPAQRPHPRYLGLEASCCGAVSGIGDSCGAQQFGVTTSFPRLDEVGARLFRRTIGDAHQGIIILVRQSVVQLVVQNLHAHHTAGNQAVPSSISEVHWLARLCLR